MHPVIRKFSRKRLDLPTNYRIVSTRGETPGTYNYNVVHGGIVTEVGAPRYHIGGRYTHYTGRTGSDRIKLLWLGWAHSNEGDETAAYPPLDVPGGEWALPTQNTIQGAIERLGEANVIGPEQTLHPGETLRYDLGQEVSLEANQRFWVRSDVTVAPGDVWSLNNRKFLGDNNFQDIGGIFNSCALDGPLEDDVVIPPGDGEVYPHGCGPFAVIGIPRARDLHFLLQSDSIGWGAGDTGPLVGPLEDERLNIGYVVKGLKLVRGSSVAWAMASRIGDRAEWATGVRGRRRPSLYRYANIMLFALGTNDIGGASYATPGRSTVSATKWRLRALIRKARRARVRTVLISNIAPRCNDLNDDPQPGFGPGEHYRDTLNRVIASLQHDGVVDGLVDVATAWEQPGTGLWKPALFETGYDDGTHPGGKAVPFGHPLVNEQVARFAGVAFTSNLDEDTNTIVDAWRIRPSMAKLVVLDTFITGLKTDGLWAIIDALWMFGLHDPEAALVNMRSPGRFMAWRAGPVTFTPYSGFTGNGTSSFIYTTYFHAPSLLPFYVGTRLAHHFGFSVLTDVTSDGKFDAGNNLCRVNTRDLANRIRGGVSISGLATLGTANMNSIGDYTANRPDAATSEIYKNGTLFSSIASAGIETGADYEVAACAHYGPVGAQNFSPRTVGSLHGGGALNAAQITAMYTRKTTFKTAFAAA